jgi:hypothetical protein
MVLFCPAPPLRKFPDWFSMISARSRSPGSGKNPKALTGFAGPNGCQNRVDPVHRERLTMEVVAAKPRSSLAIPLIPTRPVSIRLFIGSCPRPSGVLRMSPRWLDCSSGKIPDDLATHVGQIMHLPPSPRAARGDFLFMFSIISIIIPFSSACFGRS